MPLAILLVDDEPDIRTIATMALRDISGFDVDTAHAGDRALELATSRTYDAILLDVMMPGLDGVKTFQLLAERSVKTPVIFMTAKTQRREMESYLALGAAGVIQKPFDPVSLGDEVHSILARPLR
ncbi:MAG: response regulator [Deltaproteobacteria bacterium]|nr:response regulator [Deltaproteobacteria bacterium]